MNTDIFIIRNDLSRCGVRRWHVIGEKEAAIEEVLAMMEAEKAEVSYFGSWVDEGGMRHVYAAWKSTVMDEG